jgi:hypothetical protein
MIGLTVSPMKTPAELEGGVLNRQDRLQKLIFSFPKNPENGGKRLDDHDFKNYPDPLDELENVWEE